MANGRFSHAAISQVHTNTDQELIQITDDKLRLILKEHLGIVEQKKEWITPFGVLLSILGVFVSAEFKNALGMKAETWQAVFVIIGLLSAAWLVKCLVNLYRCPNLNDVIDIIKNSPGSSGTP